MRAIAALLILSLGADPAPPYEAYSKRELWETIVKCDSANLTRQIDIDACMNKLGTRTATVINQITLPNALQEAPKGHSMELVVTVGVVAFVVGGIVSALIFKKSEPSTVVVR